jgi:hypothetical protein
MEALKILPYDVKTLTNIAQVHIKEQHLDDGLEFLSRTLYLEPTHVKALSRKAFVLSTTGREGEALQTAREALKQDPSNNDLISQVRDLEAIVKENQDEITLKAMLNTTTSDETDSAPASKPECCTSEPRKATKATALDFDADVEILTWGAQALSEHFAQLISAYNSRNEEGCTGHAQIHDTGRLSEKALEKLSSLKTSNPATIVASIVASNPMLKVYMRTSKALQTSILPELQQLLDVISADEFRTLTDSFMNVTVGATVDYVNLVCSCIKEERTSKVQVIESRVLGTVINTVMQTSWILMPNMRSLLIGIVNFIAVCCEDDVCPRSQKLVHSNRAVFGRLAVIVGELSVFCAGCHFQTDLTAAEDTAKLLNRCASLARSFSQSEEGRTLLKSGETDVGAIVPALGTCLHVVVAKWRDAEECRNGQAGNSRLQSELAGAVESFVSSLLCMSQVESLRRYFGIVLPTPPGLRMCHDVTLTENLSSEAVEVPTDSLSAVSSLMTLMQYKSVHTVNCLAVIMNALLDSESIVKAEVERLKLGFIAMARLTSCDRSGSGTATDEDDICLRNRYAGLLSRLVTTESLGRSLSTESNFRVLCQEFVWTQCASSSAVSLSAQAQKWLSEEVGHLVRLIAGLPKPTEATARIALAEDLFTHVFKIFPSPRRELGEITPQSVIQMPGDMPAPLLMGNAARVLLQFGDDADCAAVMFGTKPAGKQRISIEASVEKLICSMACCTDIRVRKNIAIVLAKGSRIQSVKEKLQYFRGMQMIIELQDRIL